MSGAELSTGQTIGEKYRIERKLGAGAMGRVYAAHDTVRQPKMSACRSQRRDRKPKTTKT